MCPYKSEPIFIGYGVEVMTIYQIELCVTCVYRNSEGGLGSFLLGGLSIVRFRFGIFGNSTTSNVDDSSDFHRPSNSSAGTLAFALLGSTDTPTQRPSWGSSRGYLLESGQEPKWSKFD